MGKALLTCQIRFSSFMIGATSIYQYGVRAICARNFKSSHGPDGKMPCPNGIFSCFALVLAGRRCVHQQWHGELLIVHHHRQHSFFCACSRSKFPIAPMGKLLTCLPRLTLVQLLRSTTGGACHRDLAKFPSPRWENALLTCPFRFSSFMMGAASNYQYGVRAICA